MAPNLFRVVIPVDDVPKADAFWGPILDLPVDRTVPGRHYLHTAGAIALLVDIPAHDRAHGKPPRPFAPMPEWLYVRVPDLEATWERAQELGCPVVEEEGHGIRERVWGDRSFYTRDPFGNGVCFVDDRHHTLEGPAAKYCGKPAANLFKVILPTRSMGRSDAFFEELLQLPVDDGVWNRHFFHTDSCMLAVVHSEDHDRAHGLPRRDFRANPDLVYFAVADLDAAHERARKLGMQPAPGEDTDIRTQPWGERSFYGVDPAGNPICFVEDGTLFLGSPPERA